MEILKFTLSGKNAFFKKPEFNSYVYFTYGNIHKVALLGIFGAVLGYGGYAQMRGFERKKKQDELIESYPEFYEKLKNLKISILPIAGKKNGYISKKIQIFNNSVGYASREQGGNLIVKEQWLENPEWEICVFVDSPEAEKIKEAICGKRCVYYPYLGKNDHLADIKSVSVEEASEISFSAGRLDCLVPEDFAESSGLDFDEKKDLDISCEFKYQEALPYAIDGYLNLYILKTFIYTDDYIKMKDGVKVFQLNNGKKIVFY